MKRGSRRGQGLVEGTLVLLAFFALLLSVVDCGQVLYAHQALVERARSAARWASLHPWEGPEPIVNLVLYGQTTAPREDAPGYLGMTPANIQVTYRPPQPGRPDEETITVAIVNFQSHFVSPWLAQALVSPRPVLITTPHVAGGI